MIEHSTTVRVRYRDTDKMGVVYHSVYLEFFETGRTEMLRDLGLSNAELESRGVMLPLVEYSARLRRPARYDDLLNVESTLRLPVAARMTIDYRVLCGDELLVSGQTVHAFTTVDGMKPIRPPREFLEMVEKAASSLR